MKVKWSRIPTGLKLWAEAQGRFKALCRAHVPLYIAIRHVMDHMIPKRRRG